MDTQHTHTHINLGAHTHYNFGVWTTNLCPHVCILCMSIARLKRFFFCFRQTFVSGSFGTNRRRRETHMMTNDKKSPDEISQSQSQDIYCNEIKRLVTKIDEFQRAEIKERRKQSPQSVVTKTATSKFYIFA